MLTSIDVDALTNNWAKTQKLLLSVNNVKLLNDCKYILFWVRSITQGLKRINKSQISQLVPLQRSCGELQWADSALFNCLEIIEMTAVLPLDLVSCYL